MTGDSRSRIADSLRQGEEKVCTRCVMDTSAAGIEFDADGVCNYCREFEARAGHILRKHPAQRARERDAFVDSVKQAGKGKRYDCIVGVSGGVDSSWVLVQAVRLGLRPLAVHMDNGWNTELAQNNINNLVRALGVDLYTHVIDWDEYRALMQGFFDADVIDVELLYDNAMLAVNYRQARVHGVRDILSGSNQATEGMHLPVNWYWFKYDQRNIRALARSAGARIQTFPSIGTLGYLWARYVRRIQWVPFLDFFDYRKVEVMDTLTREYGYKPYPYKHYESVFTRFYQGYLLPAKFGVDKRRVHLSSLIVSGQLSRDAALAQLAGSPYPSAEQLEEDKRYFIKKLGWTRAALDAYVARPERPHNAFASERPAWDLLLRVNARIKR